MYLYEVYGLKVNEDFELTEKIQYASYTNITDAIYHIQRDVKVLDIIDNNQYVAVIKKDDYSKELFMPEYYCYQILNHEAVEISNKNDKYFKIAKLLDYDIKFLQPLDLTKEDKEVIMSIKEGIKNKDYNQIVKTVRSKEIEVSSQINEVLDSIYNEFEKLNSFIDKVMDVINGDI